MLRLKRVDSLEKKKCTGCGLCEQVCPVRCLEMKADKMDNLYPSIDEKNCILCGKCFWKCPSCNSAYKSKPITAYVAYHLNDKIIQGSASGGIASAIYEYEIVHHGMFAGTEFDDKYNLIFRLGKNDTDVNCFRGSKYVYSFVKEVYSEIEKLSKEQRIVFIGLPCQVAAVKKLCGERENLFLVDILCHGVGSQEYLKNHIKNKSKGQKISRIEFRDSFYQKKGKDYIFSLYDIEDNLVYKKKVDSIDVYQIGYHNALFYRDSCYECSYATKERIGDLTIGDYFCIGSKYEYHGKMHGISLILCNTEKGQKYVNALLKEKIIFAEQRPLDESLTMIRQLNQPSKRNNKRNIFINEYEKTRDFERSALKALKIIRIENFLKNDIVWNIWNIIIPNNVKCRVKKIVKKYLKFY